MQEKEQQHMLLYRG